MEEEREQIVISLLLTVCIVLFVVLQALNLILWRETPMYVADQNQIHVLHNENLELEDQLLHLESYTYIASVSAKRGFVPLLPDQILRF